MTLAALFASGRAVDLVLGVMLAEVAFLAKRRRRPLSALVLALLPGALLLLALRAALTGVAWPWIALLVAASFPAHLADMRRRGF